MGYDLIPRNKEVDEVSFVAFVWPEMLKETGMGYVLGYGKGIEPWSYVYNAGNSGSPSSNDGYRVNAFEAKAMAMVARGYISVHRFINKQYDEMSPEERKSYESSKEIYQQPKSENFLDSLKKFADFADKSGGFRIY